MALQQYCVIIRCDIVVKCRLSQDSQFSFFYCFILIIYWCKGRATVSNDLLGFNIRCFSE